MRMKYSLRARNVADSSWEENWSTEESSSSSSSEEDIALSSSSDEHEWPKCFTQFQRYRYCNMYAWLNFQDQKLGCTACRAYRNLGPPFSDMNDDGWAFNEIKASGNNEEEQLSSLQKQLYDHSVSASHIIAFSWIRDQKAVHGNNIVLKPFPHFQKVVIPLTKVCLQDLQQNSTESSGETDDEEEKVDEVKKEELTLNSEEKVVENIKEDEDAQSSEEIEVKVGELDEETQSSEEKEKFIGEDEDTLSASGELDEVSRRRENQIPCSERSSEWEEIDSRYDSEEEAEEWPRCWSRQLKDKFCSNFTWLNIVGQNIGCVVCAKFRSLGLPTDMWSEKDWADYNWAINQVTYDYRVSQQQQITSLRNKIHWHKKCPRHIAAVTWIKKQTLLSIMYGLNDAVSSRTAAVPMQDSELDSGENTMSEVPFLHWEGEEEDDSRENCRSEVTDGVEAEDENAPRCRSEKAPGVESRSEERNVARVEGWTEMTNVRLQDICLKLDQLSAGIGELVKRTEENGAELKMLREVVSKRLLPQDGDDDDDEEQTSNANKNHKKNKYY